MENRYEMLILTILDGFGLNESPDGNAIAHADTPNLDILRKRYPTCTLSAAGEAVGLPDGQMGNSEVGHLNIGAGRIVYQDLTRISNIRTTPTPRDENIYACVSTTRMQARLEVR